MEAFNNLKKSIGLENPKLNDVLKWYSTNNRDRYSHFEVSAGVGFFVIYESEDTYSFEWNLDFLELKNQNDELITWLSEL